VKKRLQPEHAEIAYPGLVSSIVGATSLAPGSIRSQRSRVLAAVTVACGLLVAPASSAPERVELQLSFVRNGAIFLASLTGRDARPYLRPLRSAKTMYYTYYDPA
jgi:hypothetical protein